MLAGLSVSTVKNLFGGETRRPAHTTYGKIAGALGYTYKPVRDATPDYQAEIPIARKQFKAHKKALAKKREREARNGKGK